MSFTDFVKPYPNGYEDGESGNTPVTAAILNTNYDGFLLALNTWAAGMETSLNQKADSSSVGQAISAISGRLVNMQDDINQKSTVSLSDLLSTGTLIGTMTINGVTYDLYAPSGGSGGSSVEWEQIQLTGTKIAEVTIDGVTTDIYAPSGGSGGSGHTILDDDGTALAQEDDLQFVGVYSEDNPTDEVTKVNIYREMTKSEFDLLSDDEKKGFIRVTDEPDIYSDGKFQPVIYSTEEREIGVWKDGKPLYQKTLNVASVGSIGSSLITPIQINDIPFDYIEVVEANIYDSIDNRRYILPNLSKDTSDRIFLHPYLNKSSSPVVFYASLYTGGTTYSNMLDFNVIIQYTKTTDTAGSGTWTPQGVPAHHYSTDEHIVGTWIDGSTIWEKTVAVTTNNTTSFVLATGVSTLISSKGCIGDYSIPAPYFDSNRQYISVLFAQTAHEVRVYSLGSNYNNLTGYVTIQYTKSS